MILPDSLYLNATQYTRWTVTPPTSFYDGFRCLHVPEGGYATPEGMPEVRPSVNARPVEFTKEMQLLAMDLNDFNPLYTGAKYRSTYHNGIAFCNGNGYEKPGDPRADHVNLRDLQEPLPKLMKGIICGGMFIRGQVEGNLLVVYPGIHAIDAAKPIPPFLDVIERNWYFHATTWSGVRVNNFPQGAGQPVIVPYILREPTPYPLAWFARWQSSELPDHLKIYG